MLRGGESVEVDEAASQVGQLAVELEAQTGEGGGIFPQGHHFPQSLIAEGEQGASGEGGPEVPAGVVGLLKGGLGGGGDFLAVGVVALGEIAEGEDFGAVYHLQGGGGDELMLGILLQGQVV